MSFNTFSFGRQFNLASWLIASLLCLGFCAETGYCQKESEDPDSFDRIAYRKEMLSADLSKLDSLYKAETERWNEALAEVSEASDRYRHDSKGNYGFWRNQFITGRNKGELARQRLYEILVRRVELTKKATDDEKNFLLANIRLHVSRTQNYTALRATEALIQAGRKDNAVLFYSVLANRSTNQFQNALRRLQQLQAKGFRPQAAGEKTYRGILSTTPVLDTILQTEKSFIEKDQKASLPIAEIETSVGVLEVELFEDDAPNTVGNFIVLAERGFFDGHQFFNVGNDKAVTGSPNNKKDGNSGFKIPRETGKRGKRGHLHGYLVMEIPEDGQISSQFGILLRPTIARPEDLTTFGRVISGLEVLDHLRKTQKNSTIQPDKIIKVTIKRKRDHKYQPVAAPIL